MRVAGKYFRLLFFIIILLFAVSKMIYSKIRFINYMHDESNFIFFIEDHHLYIAAVYTYIYNIIFADTHDI